MAERQFMLRLKANCEPADVAEQLVGIKEKTGRNDGTPSEMFMDGDELPWCAGFVLYCFKSSTFGAIKGNRWKLRSVRNLFKTMSKSGNIVGRNVNPLRNDVVFFNKRGNSDAGTGWRCGIVVAVSDGIIYTIEGNLSNMVKVSMHHTTDAPILGYGRMSSKIQALKA